MKEFSDDHFIFMASASGMVKKTPLSEFSRPRTKGIISCDLRDDDALVGVALTDGHYDVLLFTSAGKAIRFAESEVRPMGRGACGVIGIRLGDAQRVIALIAIPDEEGTILTASANGYGKRTAIAEFTRKGRAGQGVRSLIISERNCVQVGALWVRDDDEIMLITDGGTLVRTRVSDLRVMGRDTQGVTLIRLAEGERLVGMDRIESTLDEEEGPPGETTGESNPALTDNE
ncbi:DNA gyrase subunit A (fragment) [Gammaproteobacteria bacterium]